MGPTEKLIEEYAVKQNPLCGPIHWPQEENLINALRSRLDLSQKELDESPASLKRLETSLQEYAQRKNIITGEDIIRFIREVTIYVGKVMILHCGGRWHTVRRNLRTSEIEVITEEHVRDKIGKFTVPIAYPIGIWVAYSWDEINSGNLPVLYKLFLKASRIYKKRLKWTS
jgi:hypothetical protein